MVVPAALGADFVTSSLDSGPHGAGFAPARPSLSPGPTLLAVVVRGAGQSGYWKEP
jgi:hypothetical protein